MDKESRRVELILEGDNLYNINAMRKNLGESLFRNAGVFRSEETLSSALEYSHYLMGRKHGLHCIHKERDNNVELASILEFENALTIADGFAGALVDGGGILNHGTLNVSNSTFSGNSAGAAGGGIANTNTAVVSNSTFSGNSDYAIFHSGFSRSGQSLSSARLTLSRLTCMPAPGLDIPS